MCVWSVSKESQEVLNAWTHHDNQQDSFCETEGTLHHLSVNVVLCLVKSVVAQTCAEPTTKKSTV